MYVQCCKPVVEELLLLIDLITFSFNFCSTRVIKANGPDIGRKVKVKATGRTIPPITNARHRESASIPTSSSQSSRPVSAAPVASLTTSSSSSSSSYKPIPSTNAPLIRNQPEKKVSDIMRRPLRYVMRVKNNKKTWKKDHFHNLDYLRVKMVIRIYFRLTGND